MLKEWNVGLFVHRGIRAMARGISDGAAAIRNARAVMTAPLMTSAGTAGSDLSPCRPIPPHMQRLAAETRAVPVPQHFQVLADRSAGYSLRDLMERVDHLRPSAAQSALLGGPS